MVSKVAQIAISVGLLASAQLVQAHTWVEQLMVIAPNGTMVGQPGFPRGNVLRSTPGFGDPAMVNLIPPTDGTRGPNDIRPTDLMCKFSQTSQTQTDGSPRLQAMAGAAVALRYQENGHVTLPQSQPGKPENRGTVYVYGTTQPSPDDSLLAIHRQWTPDGSGGDGRGVLLSTQNFDTGSCYQINGGAISTQRQQQYPHVVAQPMGGDIWCQQDVALPDNLASNTPYTLYWVWDWPTMPGTAGFPEGKQEIYTTCMDIDIVDSLASGVEPVSKATVSYQEGQDLNWAAVPEQMADIRNPTAVKGQSIAFSASATGPAEGQAATESASAALPGVSSEIPGFLSVHTTSSEGAAGLQTQTFSVVPIGAATPTTLPTDFTAGPQQTGQPGREQDGDDRPGPGGNLQGFNNIGSATNIGAVVATPTNGGPAVVTQYYTEYQTAWETVFTTVYDNLETQRVKRDAEPEPTASCSRAHGVFRLKARIPFVAYRPEGGEC